MSKRAIAINIYNGTGLQIPKSVTLDDVETYQDIITKLINMGEKSGKLYTLNGNRINNKDFVTIQDLNYITSDSEPTHIITVVTNTDPPSELSIPYSSDMIYEDVYNYALAQSSYRLGFLRLHGALVSLSETVTDVGDLTLELGVIIHISSKGVIMKSTYISDGSIYQDIVTTLIQSGERSGRIFTLQSKEVEYNSPILESELHYIITMPEPTYVIPVTVVGAPLYSIEIPASAEMSYMDVYNYVVSQVQPNRKMFLVTNNGRTDLTRIITDASIFAFYELP